MPANNDYPVIDGIAPSWADLVCSIAPTDAPLIDMKAIQSINTGVTVEVGQQRAGGRMMKRTTGSRNDEASATFYYDGYIQLLRGLKNAALAAGFTRGNQAIVGLVSFSLQIQYTPPGAVEIFETRLKGCRLLGRNLNGSEGTDPIVPDVTLSPAEIVDLIDGVEVILL